MAHTLVLGLFRTPSLAADAAGALHALGIRREHLSVVAPTHDDAQALADRMDATAGVDLEDSRPAARLGELGGRVLATVALAMPGIGPLVAAGPLSAELGEIAGHAAGSLASVLTSAGLPHDRAEALQHEVARGAGNRSGPGHPVCRRSHRDRDADLAVIGRIPRDLTPPAHGV